MSPARRPALPAFHARIQLLRLAAPLVVSRAGLAAMVVVDAVMVAHYATGDLAAARLAEGTFGRLADIAMAFMHAALALVAGLRAPAATQRRIALWRRALFGAGLLGGLGLVGAWFAPAALLVLGQEAELARATGTVIAILALGLPAGLVALACAVHLEGVGRPGLVARWMIAANLANIALNWLLIGGPLGLPAWGAAGSALATGLVRLGLAFALIAALRRVEGPALFRPAMPAPGDAGRHWRTGLGVAGAAAAMHLLGIWLIVFAGWLGPLPLAAFASVFVLGLPGLLLAAGIGDAIAVRVAGGTARRLRSDLAVLAWLLTPLAAAFCLAPSAVAALYTPDPGLRALLATLLPLGGAVLLLDGVSYGAVAALRAAKDVAIPSAIQIGALAATLPLAAFLAFGLGLAAHGLLAAILITSALRLALLGWRLLTIFAPAEAGLSSLEQELA